MDRSCDMGKILILLILGLAAADKLDRTYLPPPGAKFSGGNPEDLQIPFEFPKRHMEDTSKTATIVPDKNILRSGYVSSTNGPNIKEIVDTISNSKSPQTYFSNTPPVNAYTYFPTTSSKHFFSESLKNPLKINQDIKQFGSQKYDANLDYSVPNTQITGTFSRISQNSVPAYQYSALDVPLFGTKSAKPAVLNNIKKFSNHNTNNSELNFQLLNAHNQVSQHSQDNTLINGQEAIVPLTENVQNLGSNVIPITKNYQSNGIIQTLQYSPNAKTIDNNLNSYINPGNNKLDSTIPTSNIKPKLSVPDTMISGPSVKSRLPFPRINTKIASSKIRQRPERPQAEDDRNALILNYRNVITPKGYSYTYDTSNGISANESGTANNGVRANGAYSYTGDDGKVYRVIYTADENGFLPRGDHIPPVPIAIQRLIEKAARENNAGISDDGSYDEAKYGHTQYQGAMERYHPEFQGITNNDINQFGDYSGKRFGGKDIRRPIKTIPESKQHEYNGNNYGIHEPYGKNRHQVDTPVVLPSYLGRETIKQPDNRFFDHLSDQQQNVNNFSNQGMTKSADLILSTKQQQRALNQPSNPAIISLEYSSKKTLHRNQNTPEIIENSNPNIIENNQAILANKQNGYFYTTPQNKFIENGNQVNNKDRNQFTIDHELEIGDDDIITISVPSPNNFSRVNNEVLLTVSPYNRQYTLENIVPEENNDNQGISNPEKLNNPTYNVNLTTMSSDINIQPNESLELITPAKYGISMNSEGDLGFEKYGNVQKPKGQIVQENDTLNLAVDEFGRPITQDLSTNLKFDGQNPNIGLSDFENTFGIADGGNLNKGDKKNVSNNIDNYRKGFEFSKTINNQSPDRISKATAKTIIGEDFTGPKRPQTFDPENGYYY